MKYVFGPVPSRRLGQSLGIDPVPFKTCNWNCVYCQLGRTSPLTNERRDYFPPDEIVAEVATALAAHGPGEIDWITFVGSGETTLHASLGVMLRQVKTMTDLPVAVITNGSLLDRPEVRAELLPADAVLPTVDAGTERLYQRINRPLPALRFDRLIDGLVAFRNEYQGQLWVEVMLIRGLNDTDEALRDLHEVLARMRPNEVHLNSPTRPPCEPWVVPVEQQVLSRAQQILGQVAQVVRPSRGEWQLAEPEPTGVGNLVDDIIAVITRHPVSEEDLIQTLQRWQPGHVREILAELARGGRAQAVERAGRRFWSGAPARYVPE